MPWFDYVRPGHSNPLHRSSLSTMPSRATFLSTIKDPPILPSRPLCATSLTSTKKAGASGVPTSSAYASSGASLTSLTRASCKLQHHVNPFRPLLGSTTTPARTALHSSSHSASSPYELAPKSTTFADHCLLEACLLL